MTLTLKSLRVGKNWRKAIVDEFTSLTARVSAIEHVGTSELDDDSVTADKINYFMSTEQTGTGEAQNVPHGLGASPTFVAVIPSTVGGDGGSFSFTKGSTNVVVTATSGAKYFVLAIK